MTGTRPAPAPLSGARFFLAALLPALVLGAITFPLRYRDGVGDGDVDFVVNAVMGAQWSGLGWAASHASLSYMFGFYWFVEHWPSSILRDATALMHGLTLMGWIAAIVFGAALGGLLARRHGWHGVAATLVVLLSPMFLELAVSAHPQVTSMALLFLGALALAEAARRTGAVAWALRVAALLLLAASLSARADSLLAFPFVAWLGGASAPAASGRRRWLAPAIVVTLAAALFFVVQTSILSRFAVGTSSAWTLQYFFRKFFDPRVAPLSVALTVIGAGLVTSLALPVGILRGWRRAPAPGATSPGPVPGELIGAALLSLPSFFFWLPIGGPARHFMLVLVGLAWGAAWASSRLDSPRRALGWAALLVVLNQAAAEATYAPLVRCYPWKYLSTTERRATRTVPMGWVLANHRALQRDLLEYRREGQALARSTEPEVVMLGDQIQYAMMALWERGHATRRDSLENEVRVVHMDVSGQRFRLIEKGWYWPKDVAWEYFRAQRKGSARYHVQPTTRSIYDREPFPPDSLKLELK